MVKQYDAVVIGAGLSGLTAASLLGKRGLRVAVVEHHRSPGGSCGAFKRGDALFDQGSAMLFGFWGGGFQRPPLRVHLPGRAVHRSQA